MRYRPVRALSRGLAVLNALASMTRATSVDLSEATGIHRTTVKRLLETLCEQGYVRLSPSDETYRLARGAHALCAAPIASVVLAEVAVPVLADLVRAIRWPSELAVPAGDDMLVQESTHRQSPLAIEPSTVGRRYPMLSSALGHAYLAFADDGAHRRLAGRLGLAEGQGEGPALAGLLAQTRRQGYAERLRDPCPKTASIALPVRYGDRVAACLRMSYFRSALRPAEAAARYVPLLKEAVEQIERSALRREAPQERRIMRPPAMPEVSASPGI
jgi:IclR family mhp operon transcriptional activator